MPLRTFLTEILAYESGISPSRWEWYIENFDAPAMTYWAVHRAGRLARRWDSGDPVTETVTIRGYFERIGVLGLFDRRNSASCRQMQYRSMNPWGFVGYQFGEAALIDLGYYVPAFRAQSASGISQYPSYYLGGVPNHVWREGRTTAGVSHPSTGVSMIATDVNTWGGAFTGRRGVVSFNAFCQPEAQDAIMVDLLDMNLRCIEADLEIARSALSEHLTSSVTLSGLLAAAHLCGAHAVSRYLLAGSSSVDEAGTSLESYIERFADLPLDDWCRRRAG